MKRQALILSSIYLIIMCLGYIWCYPFFKIETILFDLIFRTVLWSISSYGLYIVLLILKKFSLLKNIAISKPFLITCLPYIYLIIFLVEGFIGLVMVLFLNHMFCLLFFFNINYPPCNQIISRSSQQLLYLLIMQEWRNGRRASFRF